MRNLLPLIAIALLTSCEQKKAIEHRNRNYIELAFIRDTFIGTSVLDRPVYFSFDGSGDYDLMLMTLPVAFKEGDSLRFIRQPFILVNPKFHIAKTTSPNLEETVYPRVFTRDSQFLYLKSIWDDLEGKRVFFRLPYGKVIERRFVRITPDTLIMEGSGKRAVITDYANSYINVLTMQKVEPRSEYDALYHIKFHDGIPYLNIFRGLGVAVSIGDSVDRTITAASGLVLHENRDRDDFYTDRYLSLLGDRWFTVDSWGKLIPRKEVYILEKSDTLRYAFQILDFYYPDDPTRPGYITLRYGLIKKARR